MMNVVAPPLEEFHDFSEDALAILWFDVTDFIQYCEGGNTTVSGIQRVTANIALHADQSGADAHPVLFTRGNAAPLVLDRAAFRELVMILQAGITRPSDIKRLLQKLHASATRIVLRRGDMLLICGAFWIYDSHDYLIRIRAAGLKLVVLVYDLIQIMNPEYVAGGSNIAYQRSLIDILAVADLVCTISDYVKSDVETFMAARLGISLPVATVTLPTALPDVHGADATLDARVIALAKRDYVLCVGTLEVRKNHLYLIRVWEALRRQNPEAVPHLVLVGKWGWKIDDFRSYVEKRGYVGDWLHIFTGLSDANLDHLYRHCLFTAYPSFAEGWGLPVGESLAYGKPCIASGVTSIPEVGGRFVRYTDPFDVERGTEIYRATLADREGIARWQDDIRQNFVARTWQQYCQDFYAVLNAVPARQSDHINYVVEPRRLYAFGDRDLAAVESRGEKLATPRMARSSGWDAIGPTQVWSVVREARLDMPTTLAAGTAVLVHLVVQGPAGRTPPVFSVAVGGIVTKLGLLPAVACCRRVAGVVDADGILRIVITADTAPDADAETPDEPENYIGLSAIAFCEPQDVEGRLDIMEAILGRGLGSNRPDDARNFAAGFALTQRLLFGPARPRGWLSRLIARYALERARYAARRRRWADAERCYLTVLRHDPTNTSALMQYAHVMKEQAQYQGSAIAYGMLISLRPDDGEARIQLKFVESKLKD